MFYTPHYRKPTKTERIWTERHATLPYGVWIDADGREILFNRDYKPIWQRKDGVVSEARYSEWVHWKKQNWFYNDGSSPMNPFNKKRATAAAQRCEKILDAFKAGLPIEQYIDP